VTPGCCEGSRRRAEPAYKDMHISEYGALREAPEDPCFTPAFSRHFWPVSSAEGSFTRQGRAERVTFRAGFGDIGDDAFPSTS
jgi:hypothetical protein